MERVSGEFAQGYTKAIKDMQEEFLGINRNLYHHNKRFSHKLNERAFNLFLEHRDNFRENRGGFIRFNPQKNDLEYFERRS